MAFQRDKRPEGSWGLISVEYILRTPDTLTQGSSVYSRQGGEKDGGGIAEDGEGGLHLAPERLSQGRPRAGKTAARQAAR